MTLFKNHFVFKFGRVSVLLMTFLAANAIRKLRSLLKKLYNQIIKINNNYIGKKGGKKNLFGSPRIADSTSSSN